MLLTDYAETWNSQFGEEGIIYECLGRIGIPVRGAGVCVDIGASDGRECSNTLNLRDLGWTRWLYEVDTALVERREEHERDMWFNVRVMPDTLLPDDFQFISIDVDGMDYFILEKMKARPHLVCVEYNQTIPLNLDVVSTHFGASLTAMIRMMSAKGYGFVGATHCNAFFVEGRHLLAFADIDNNPRSYFDESNLTYLVSDSFGGVVAFGPQYFGTQKRFAGPIDIVHPDGTSRTIWLPPDSTQPL